MESKKVQILRGLAIIAVVFIHNTPGGLAQVFCRPFLNFSVGLFLFLSGMLSDAGRYDPGKRLKKVLIPYVLWTLIYTVAGGKQDLLLRYAGNLLTGQGAAVMYYVFVYCELTLLLPLIDRLARSRYRYLGFVITPAEIVCMRLIPAVLGCEVGGTVSTIMSLSCLGWFTYYYLGYLLGNKIIAPKIPANCLAPALAGAVLIQILEGYWYYRMGVGNCGTQLKLSAILTGALFVLLAYRFIYNGKNHTCGLLKLLGDHSFGIFFSHIAVMGVLAYIPFYNALIRYPLNAVLTLAVDMCCIYVGGKILGKYREYLAL